MKGGRPLALMGFSGSGKTSVAKYLEERYEWNWIDLDSAIEQSSGRKISEIFRVDGEKAFRKLEKEELKRALEKDFSVLSLGGGAVLDSQNRKLLSQRTNAFYLSVSALSAAKRVYSDELKAIDESVLRPLLAGGKELSLDTVYQNVSSLMEERRGIYEFAKNVVCTDYSTVAAVAEVIAEQVLSAPGSENHEQEDLRVFIPAEFAASTASKFVIAKGELSRLVKQLAVFYSDGSKYAVLLDAKVAEIWGEQLFSAFKEERLEHSVFLVPSGEQSKNLSEVERIAEEMLSAGFSRQDIVFAVGGGVVGDLAGLLASLYMRGISLINVPTTVVAQVDSAIGGKTAVNLAGGKNSLGTFYPADCVVSDLDFLSSLPEREYLAGFAEVIKYGLIASRELFDYLEVNVEEILARKEDYLAQIVERCTRIKLDCVCLDLFDKTGLRAKLNFGHTVGHAVEKLASYGCYLHGEAISIGMIQALRLGIERGLTGQSVLERAEALLVRYGLPLRLPEELVDGLCVSEKDEQGLDSLYAKWFSALSADKKRVAVEEINFVFVEDIGSSSVGSTDIDSLISLLASSENKN